MEVIVDMDSHEIQLPDNHQDVVDRFIAACQTDERIVAAFLGGSYANGVADKFSDLDLFFITTDEAYEDFLSERKAFIRLLGEPLFLEDFGVAHGYCVIFSNGTEGDVWFGRESKFKDIYGGPYRVLLDRKESLAGEVFPKHVADQAAQIETLRQQIDWFWHELSHFIKAMGRRQLWFAYGQLEVIRQNCVNLARLRYNFSDAYVGEEPYFKVEQALPIEELSPLQTTFCSMKYEAMLQAALVICRFYQDVAPNLAKAHSITYQADLERMMISQLEELGDLSMS
jgi:predicted nucleotidyltransferase